MVQRTGAGLEEIRSKIRSLTWSLINYMILGVILLETQTTSALKIRNIYLEGLSGNKGSRRPFVNNGISRSTAAATGMPRRGPGGPFRGRGAAPGLSPGPRRPPPPRGVARAARPHARPPAPLARDAAGARSPPATWPPLAVPASHLVPRVGLTAREQPPRSASCLTSARSPSSAPRKRQPRARPSLRARSLRRRRRERAARPPPPPSPRPGRRSPVAGGASAAAPGSAPVRGSRRAAAAGLLQRGLRGWAEPPARVLSGTSNYFFLRACCWSP